MAAAYPSVEGCGWPGLSVMVKPRHQKLQRGLVEERNDKTKEHGITLAEMRLWQEDKILQFVREHRCEDMNLLRAWNETHHPEYLFQSFFDDVLRDKYSPKEWEKLFAEIDDLLVLEEGQSPREFLEDNIWFWEDAAELAPKINSAYQTDLEIYAFRFLLKHDVFSEEFLLGFANGVLD